MEQKLLPNLRSLHPLTLTTSEQNQLLDLASSVVGDPYSDFEAFFQNIIQIQEDVPERIKGGVKELREARRGGALLIRGLPLGKNICATPGEPFAKQPILDLGSEIFLVMISTLVAEPFSFREWDAGFMVHNKYPIRSHREVQFGSNAVEFLVHTETPFREFSPDYIALLCLREDPTGEAVTRLCDIGEIIESLSDADREVLQGAFFAFETDNPAVQIDGKSYTLPMPIITTRDRDQVFEYVHDLVGIHKEAQEVLNRLKSKVEAAVVDLFLTGGDLIIIDNSHMVHGRSAYEPNYDGTDRWLQRLLLTSRLVVNQNKQASRLVSDKKLEHYTTEYRNVLQGLNP